MRVDETIVGKQVPIRTNIFPTCSLVKETAAYNKFVKQCLLPIYFNLASLLSFPFGLQLAPTMYIHLHLGSIKSLMDVKVLVHFI